MFSCSQTRPPGASFFEVSWNFADFIGLLQQICELLMIEISTCDCWCQLPSNLKWAPKIHPPERSRNVGLGGRLTDFEENLHWLTVISIGRFSPRLARRLQRSLNLNCRISLMISMFHRYFAFPDLGTTEKCSNYLSTRLLGFHLMHLAVLLFSHSAHAHNWWCP